MTDAPPNPLISITEEPFNAETPLSGLRSDITPSGQVYVRNHFEVPVIDSETWSLALSGAVKKTASWTLAELKALPQVEQIVTLECAGNGRSGMDPAPVGTPWDFGAVSFVRCTGTSLVNLLQRADLAGGALEVLFLGADRGEVAPGRVEGFARSLTLEDALDPDTMLVWDINGEPLTPMHGHPLRLIVPGWYGMASVKWLEEIRVLREPFAGFFQAEHYVYWEDAEIQDGQPVRRIRLRSLTTFPEDGMILGRGSIPIEGIAWGGDHPVSGVIVSTDRGITWENAEMEPSVSVYSGRRWRFDWEPEAAGAYTILGRAFDSEGGSQPLTHRWNRLGYGNNAVRGVRVRIV